MINTAKLAWDKMNGLLPCIVQDAFSGKVLMQGYMNPEAVEKTCETGLVTFYSRSKNRLWTKGETSGNTLKLKSITADCDQDALLALAIPKGPTCHLGTESCFDMDKAEQPVAAELADLERTILSRVESSNEKSYTAALLEEGVRRCAQKVGEEGVEVALAAVAQDDKALINESADLLYHLLVTLRARDLSIEDVVQELRNRAR